MMMKANEGKIINGLTYKGAFLKYHTARIERQFEEKMDELTEEIVNVRV